MGIANNSFAMTVKRLTTTFSRIEMGSGSFAIIAKGWTIIVTRIGLGNSFAIIVKGWTTAVTR